MSIQVTKQQTNIREEITTLRGKTTPEAIIKALGQATDGVGIGTDQPEGTFTVMSHPLQWHPDYPSGTMRALSVGGGDNETSAIVIHANSFKYPTGEGFTDGSSWSSNGAYWATPMIYRSGSSVAGTAGNAQFPFNTWGELILQGTSHGTGYNKGISFVTWNKDHVDENGDPDPYSQSAMQLTMRVAETGNVGIGTSSPFHKLQIDGDTAYGTIRLESDSKTFDVGVAGSTSSNTTLRGKFYLWDEDKQATRLVIDELGKVGIGTPAPVQDLVLWRDRLSTDTGYGARLQVQSRVDSQGSSSDRISSPATYRSHTGNAYTGVLLQSRENGTINYLYHDNSGVLRTTTDGAHVGTTNGTTIGAQTSDERFKNIEDGFEYGLNHVLQLKPIAYTQKNDDTRRLGFGAQTTQNIVPESVFDTGDCVDGYDQNHDDPGNQNPCSNDTRLGMEYVQLIPVLTKAIQEQQDIIEQLQSRIDALENK